ncbi:hypothetical protein BGW38_004621 [Lunasporangiospora selenospora]|uniref:Uncharacterized protein n=1 Tax=Lunasporangiospora selenospora TaxID=979761 RepID=A0A9P6FP28_9FUNG|nr:hypothetical protein BGW38_004621 [Lunasporangiospora selenospora]
MTYGYNDPKTHARIMAKFTVETGPYLTLVTPAHVDSGREKSPIPATARSRPRLQRGAVCCQDTILSRDERSEKRPPTVATESYPFCCKGHSLVYTTQYTSGGLFPVSFRHGLRQLTRRIQAVSGLDLWTFAFGTQTEEPQIRCTIEYCGPTEQLQFCRASIDPTITSETQTSPSSFKASMTTATTTTTATRSRLREKSVVEDEDYAYAGFGYLEDSSDEDEETLTQEHINHELVQRRYRIEERMRQDTLIKQELLGLCHMACGLFQEENRAARAPPTIMSLLRKGSPWSKGTWREGEWRHDCVDYTSMAGSYQGSSSSKGAPSLPNIAQVEQGEWQKLCIATIEFLALQSLRWGGNTANAELSRLRTSVGPNAWIYHE